MLVFRIQPNEGVLLKFGLKVPGSGYKIEKNLVGFIIKLNLLKNITTRTNSINLNLVELIKIFH